MKKNIIYSSIVALLTFGITSCSQDTPGDNSDDTDAKARMLFSFSHPSQTRATDTSFETGDKVGVYVTESNEVLEIGGNVVNNEPLTFNGSRWDSSKQLYWNDGTFNAFAYYPYNQQINSISDMSFEVRTDQSVSKTATSLSGYEASDFLYASAKGIKASSDPVNLSFRHILSKITIHLIKGDDFEGDIPEHVKVLIHNTVTEATIDLSAGVATKYSKGVAKSILARQDGPVTYSAIVIPQRLSNRVPLIEVIADGVAFLYEAKFQFKPGMHHIVNLVVDKNPEQIKIEIGGEIVNWD